MATHEKKIWPEYFELVASGVKKYELRLGDFTPKPGDTLVLKEWDPVKKAYTGREVTKTVTHSSTFSIEDLSKFFSKEEILIKGITVCSIE